MFDLDARRGRIRRLAEYAAAESLDGILVDGWRRHATTWFTGYTPGYFTNRSSLWVSADGRSRFGVRFPFDLDRAQRESAGVVEPEPAASPEVLLDDGVTRIGVVSGDGYVPELTVELADRLRARGVADLIDLREVVDEWRSVKAPWETTWQADAGRVGMEALTAAGEVAVPDETDFDIAARVEAAARGMGASGVLCLVGIGAGAVITEPTGRVVDRDDPVGLELTLYHRAACTHVNRTLLPAAGGGEHGDALAVCRQARQALVAALRPGVPVAEVVAAGDLILDRAGLLEHKEYDFGHGLGCDTPEHPVLQPQIQRVVAPGNLLAVHVAVRVPDGPTAVIGGPVVVADAGARELVPDADWAVA